MLALIGRAPVPLASLARPPAQSQAPPNTYEASGRQGIGWGLGSRWGQLWQMVGFQRLGVMRVSV